VESQSRRLDSEQHQALVAHISRHLNEQDDQTLMLLSDLLRDAPQSIQVATAEERSLTRRRFLTATLSSGFVAATAGAVAVWQYGNGRGRELSEDLTRLWGLVHLYEKLDDAGLDHIVETGIAAIGTGLEAVALATDAVRTGAQIARDLLIKFESAFPAIRAGITWLEGLVAEIAQRLHLLEDAIGRAVNEVSPLTQALGGFFGAALNLLPPDVSQKIREVFDRIGEIITLLPNMIADINVKVLTPFRNEWFSDSPGKGIRGGLIDPIITKLLDPLEALLGQWSELVRHWEADLIAPTKVALSQRTAIRQEIADYKTRFALHEPEPSRTAG
jgi:hypothetical protein